MATAASIRANRMRRQRVLLGLGLLLLIGAGIFLYWRDTGRKPEPIRQPPGTITVPVAARALNKGTELAGSNLIRPMFLRPEQVPPAAILKPALIQGRVMREALRPGEYFSESSLAPSGAPAGFSGLVSPGRRIVVVDSTDIAGVQGFVREGDYVDILALSQAATGLNARRAAGTTVEGGGVQPGGGGAARRPPAGAGAAAAIPTVTAALLAEGARVVVAPRGTPQPRTRQYTVLEMSPQEAHVTTLAMSAGQILRLVYRPFNDESRVARDDGPAAFTRPPRDPVVVEVIDGVNRSVVRTTLE